MKIYKYGIEVTGEQVIMMPPRAKILSVQIQHGSPQIWALVDDSLGASEPRNILVIGTGNPMPDVGNYIGTFQMMNGSLVWHVFESEVNE